MRHIIWKAYFDYEKEEEWLNQMASKGLNLESYSWCRYVFEDGVKGKYAYRIVLMKDKPETVEGQKYLEFLEEMNIKHISSYWKWVFLRKEVEDGPFDIFSDLESKIEHNKRLLRLIVPLWLLNCIAGVVNILIVVALLSEGRPIINYIGILNIIVAAVMFFPIYKSYKKIQKYKEELKIRE